MDEDQKAEQEAAVDDPTGDPQPADAQPVQDIDVSGDATIEAPEPAEPTTDGGTTPADDDATPSEPTPAPE